jgi:hypothetical protein
MSSPPYPASVDRTAEVIAASSAAGWQIVHRDITGAQFRKPKEWSKGALILGAVLLLLWGIGLFVLLLAALDFAMSKDKVAYVSAADLARGIGPSDGKKPAATLSGLAVTFCVIVGGFIVLTIVLGLLGS